VLRGYTRAQLEDAGAGYLPLPEGGAQSGTNATSAKPFTNPQEARSGAEGCNDLERREKNSVAIQSAAELNSATCNEEQTNAVADVAVSTPQGQSGSTSDIEIPGAEIVGRDL
jgi:hypothetical protein